MFSKPTEITEMVANAMENQYLFNGAKNSDGTYESLSDINEHEDILVSGTSNY